MVGFDNLKMNVELLTKLLFSQYRQVNMRSGDAAYHTIDSLAAFWPGLQVLAGDIEAAVKLHLLCTSSFCGMELAGTHVLHQTIMSGGRVSSRVNLCKATYLSLRKHSGLPEIYDTNAKIATSHQYPLRPGWCISCRILKGS